VSFKCCILTFTAQPLAFEVSATEESLIRKHPPRRLQRLEDQQMMLSHELLDEKQEEARQRRFQVLYSNDFYGHSLFKILCLFGLFMFTDQDD